MMSLLRLWECVEKREEKIGGEEIVVSGKTERNHRSEVRHKSWRQGHSPSRLPLFLTASRVNRICLCVGKKEGAMNRAPTVEWLRSIRRLILGTFGFGGGCIWFC